MECLREVLSFLNLQRLWSRCDTLHVCTHDNDSEDGEEDEVVVYMNDPEANAPFKYPDNFIQTSRYSVVTFIPLSLLFQFKKVSNVYFLIVMVFALVPSAATISPFTAVAPLVFVLVVAMIKEGIEDIKRHRADNRANSQPTDVLRDGTMMSIPSREVRAGDVVKMYNGTEVVADIVLFASSADEGQVFIDTGNLDGETSLKSRKAIEPTWHLDDVEPIMRSHVVLHTCRPTPELHTWTGYLNLDGAEHALSIDQFLYRGCVLRNTDWVWGMVAFAGTDTKVFKNLKTKPMKTSNLDRKLNLLILLVFIIQLVFVILLCSLACWWTARHESYWYLRFHALKYRRGRLWGYRFLTYFIVISYFIPISLFVTIELCKIFQAYWMIVDEDMMEFVSGKQRHCRPNTSNLNEQLAMVRFIFTDKTGTLTENVMRFSKGNILGTELDIENLTPVLSILGNPQHPSHVAAHEYVLALALCNTIQPFKDDSKEFGLIYEGSSPDEVALVTVAAELGYRMLRRTTRTITLLVGGAAERTYNILATLPFSSNRKMMSMIIEDAEKGTITLYNKGADSFVKERLVQSTAMRRDMVTADAALIDMSSTGLRTLLVCAKDLTRDELDAWLAHYDEASKQLQNREDAVDAACLEMEKDMRLLGVTAIEDRLQDQVPETLSYFLSAGVVVWMLTGDKRETAVTIAATSTLLDPRQDFVDHIDIGNLDPDGAEAVRKVQDDLHVIEQHILLIEQERQQQAAEQLNAISAIERPRRCTFVIDGIALTVAMRHHFKQLLDLSARANSAVCCRLTPLQKSLVVRMFQKSSRRMTTLAIGDGANDVSMIQESRVGVGIIGLEGAQAALAADYAIPRFKHLRRLCAVHGRYSLVRNASCIQVSFYKNFVVAFLQLLYAFYNGFSGQSLFDGWLMTFYNIILTSIPPFLMGIFEKDLPEQALYDRPLLYTPLAHGQYFNALLITRWVVESMVHALMLYYVIYPTMIKLDEQFTDLTGPLVSTTLFCGMVLVVLVRMALQIRLWQWIQATGFAVSILLLALLMIIYSALPSLVGNTAFYWQFYNLAVTAKFWLYQVFWIGTVLVIDLTVIYTLKTFFPTSRDVAEKQFMRRNGGKM